MRHGMTASPQLPSGIRATDRRLSMQWQTPTATDFRFGFEITMYVAAR
jgi:coenzyme PQQ precursor peptide PqqA